MTTLSTRNIGKAWTKEDISQLKELAKEKRVPLRIICLKLGRSPECGLKRARKVFR